MYASNFHSDQAPARTAGREPNSVTVWRSGRLRGWASFVQRAWIKSFDRWH